MMKAAGLRWVGVLLHIVWCSACSPKTGGIEGDVFRTSPDGAGRLFAAVPIVLVSGDSTLPRGIKELACKPLWTKYEQWRDRVFKPGGDLMDMTLNLDSLELMLERLKGRANPVAWEQWRGRRALSDSIQDEIEIQRHRSYSIVDSLVRVAEVRRGATDVNGHYRFDSVPVGLHRIVAIAALGDTGVALPSAVRQFRLAEPENNDWVWMLSVNIQAGQVARTDLTPLNRAPTQWRINALCSATDSILAGRR